VPKVRGCQGARVPGCQGARVRTCFVVVACCHRAPAPHLRTFAPSHPCTFAPLHLCTLAPWAPSHPGTQAPLAPTNMLAIPATILSEPLRRCQPAHRVLQRSKCRRGRDLAGVEDGSRRVGTEVARAVGLGRNTHVRNFCDFDRRGGHLLRAAPQRPQEAARIRRAIRSAGPRHRGPAALP
jgi:hypothetical protein